MNAREPNLLHILLRVVRHAEEVLAKKCSSLIDGYSMAHDIKVRITGERRKWEANGVIDPAHRADSIPYAYEVRFALLRKVFLNSPATEKLIFLFLIMRMAK